MVQLSLPLLDHWHSSSTLFLSVFIIWPTKAKRHRYIHKKMIYDQVMGRPGDILYLPGSRRDKKWLNKAAVSPNTRKWNFLKELGVGEGSVSNTVWTGVPLDDASFHYIYYMCIGIATAILIMRISKYSYDLIVTNILWCTVFNIIFFTTLASRFGFQHETFSKLRVATSHIHHKFHSNLINISAVIQEGNHLKTFLFVMPQSLNCWPWKSKNPSSPRRSAGKIFLSSNWRIDRW